MRHTTPKPNPCPTRAIPGQSCSLYCCWLSPPVWSAAPDETGLARQRIDFLAAEQALDARKDARYRQLLRGLSDYPLLPYLEYRRLRGDLTRASPEEIERFLTQHADTPLAGLLRNVWLRQLARHGRWRDYLRFYRSGSDTERHCHYINALMLAAE